MLEKNFDEWNKLKKQLHTRERFPFIKKKEIWWCAVGLNVGSEVDGKNENFERPVIILKVYSREIAKIIPLTTKGSEGKFRFNLTNKALDANSCAMLSQIKVISARRLLRKIGKVDAETFENLTKTILEVS